MNSSHVEAQHGGLGEGQLLVGHPVDPIRVAPTLLYPKLVMDGTHQDFFPFNISQPMLHSVIKINETPVSGASKIS